MNSLEIRTVKTRRERKAFLTFPWRIYKNDPNWVPPLLPDRRKLIDPRQGVFFKRGEAEFFIARKNGRVVGTICAAEDSVTNEVRKQQECIFGFFEYVEDYQVFEALIHKVRDWAQNRDLQALLGPFNLDYENGYGVLIEGRKRPAALMCGHTPPYYQGFMEKFGFQPGRADNLAFYIDPSAPGIARIARLAVRMRERSKVVIRSVDFNRWDEEVDIIHSLLLRALAYLPGSIPWDRDALEASLRPFRNIADPEMILFAEVDGEAVGWLPGIPNLNEILIHVNGLRYPWDYLRLLWHRRRQPEGLSLKSVVLLPDYWKTGIAVIMFDEIIRRALERGYKWGDLSLTSEDNPNAPVVYDHMGGEIYKRYRVYRLELT
jgi:GNAT superfamily N-acetyltransferase